MIKAIKYNVVTHHEADKNFFTPAYDTFENRYRIVDIDTGEVLDDAQGYGYKTAQKAYASFAYKNHNKSKDKDKVRKARYIKKWLKEHKDFLKEMYDLAEAVNEGGLGWEAKFNAKLVQQLLDEEGLKPDFKAGELLTVWKQLKNGVENI